jgi:hypothetical protein
VSEWVNDRRVVDASAGVCVHGVGLTAGLWCGSCLAEVWRRHYAPESDQACEGATGCNAMGPCATHRPPSVVVHDHHHDDPCHRDCPGYPPEEEWLGCVHCGQALPHEGTEWVEVYRCRLFQRIAERAWDECAGEAHALGWTHDFGRNDLLSRNPYRLPPKGSHD